MHEWYRNQKNYHAKLLLSPRSTKNYLAESIVSFIDCYLSDNKQVIEIPL